jgi:hypothetical protein
VDVAAQVGADVVEGGRTVNRTGSGASVEGALGIAFSADWRGADFAQCVVESWACKNQVQFVEAEGGGEGQVDVTEEVF